jgi:hypothetical protein
MVGEVEVLGDVSQVGRHEVLVHEEEARDGEQQEHCHTTLRTAATATEDTTNTHLVLLLLFFGPRTRAMCRIAARPRIATAVGYSDHSVVEGTDCNA